MAGKGSKPRPVKKSIWDVNFDDIFRKSSKKKSETPKNQPRGVITQEIYNNIVNDTGTTMM